MLLKFKVIQIISGNKHCCLNFRLAINHLSKLNNIDATGITKINNCLTNIYQQCLFSDFVNISRI